MTGFLLNISLSVLSGIYAGLVVARFVKFEEIRTKIKKIIHDIDFMNDGPNEEYVLIEHGESGELLLHISELLYLKHKGAADTVSNLMSAIESTKTNPHQYTGDINDFYPKWQEIVRKLRPNIWVLLNLKLKV